MTLAGSYAGLCGALALCLLGVLRGDASDGLLLVEAPRLRRGFGCWVRGRVGELVGVVKSVQNTAVFSRYLCWIFRCSTFT